MPAPANLAPAVEPPQLPRAGGRRKPGPPLGSHRRKQRYRPRTRPGRNRASQSRPDYAFVRLSPAEYRVLDLGRQALREPTIPSFLRAIGLKYAREFLTPIFTPPEPASAPQD